MTIRLLAPAALELDDAVAHCNALVPALGDGFLSDALRAMELIERHPDAWHRMSANTRHHRLSRSN